MAQDNLLSFPAKSNRRFTYRGATLEITIASSSNPKTDADLTVGLRVFGQNETDNPYKTITSSTSFEDLDTTMDNLIDRGKDIVDAQVEMYETFADTLDDAQERHEL